MMELSIIIVNRNSKEHLFNCISSIFLNEPEFAYEVIVIDNASTDHSLQLVLKNSEKIIIIKNELNQGFSAACNKGSDTAKGQYMLFLNPDTILQKETLNNALCFFKSHPEAGIMGCRTLNPDRSIQMSSRKFPTQPRIFGHLSGLNAILKYFRIKAALPAEPDYLQGSFLMISSELFKKIGGFDEQFYLYCEDVDLCLRVRSSGSGVSYDKNTVITHIGGGTCSDHLFITAQFISSCLKLYKKHKKKKDLKILKFTIRSSLRMKYLSTLLFSISPSKANKEYRQLKDVLNSTVNNLFLPKEN